MLNYDFQSLSPHDFELLSRDLLQEHLNITLESFKAGKDGGIDLRYCADPDHSLIVQCKHYARSNFNAILRAAEREARKLRKLKPARYVLTTSRGLSPANKDRLRSVLKPFCKSEQDIYSRDDLNNLLGKFPRIERQHFKLWITSTEMLLRILDSGVFTRSDLTLEEIQRRLCLFVPTNAMARASRLLARNGYCLFAGIPGIGKTTTAQVLVSQHVSEGWECVTVSSDVEEAFRTLKRDAKQIFFYDDFLGQTRLSEKLQKNEDRRLIQLIRTCARQRKHKRFVLTTREYLLQQAKSQHELLARSGIELAKCTVSLEDYAQSIRAQILVNHLYFFGIKPAVYRRFVETGQGAESISHPNYNPRVIETVCERQSRVPLTPKRFGDQFLAMLNNPEEIWSHAFHNQLSVNARQLLRLFAVNGTEATSKSLEVSFRRYEMSCAKPLVDFAHRFRSALAELEGNFLQFDVDEDSAEISFHSPAVKDFIDKELKCDVDFLELFLAHQLENSALLNAAQLLEDRLVPERYRELVRDAIDRVYAHDLKTTSNSGIDDAEILIEWAKIVWQIDSVELDRRLAQIIDTFLDTTGARRVHVTPLVSLYRMSQKLSQRSKSNSSWSLDDFIGVFAGKTYLPEDFEELRGLVTGSKDEAYYLDALIDAFLGNSLRWLDGEADDAESSETLRDYLSTFCSQAENFGITSDQYDITEIEDRIERIESDESNADALYESYEAENLGATDDSEQAESILQSLIA